MQNMQSLNVIQQYAEPMQAITRVIKLVHMVTTVEIMKAFIIRWMETVVLFIRIIPIGRSAHMQVQKEIGGMITQTRLSIMNRNLPVAH